LRPRLALSRLPSRGLPLPQPSAAKRPKKGAAAKGIVVPQRTHSCLVRVKGRVQDTLSRKGWGREHSILSQRLLFSLPQKNRPREVGVSSRAPCSSPRLFSFFPSASSPAVHVLSSKGKQRRLQPRRRTKRKTSSLPLPAPLEGKRRHPKENKKSYFFLPSFLLPSLFPFAPAP